MKSSEYFLFAGLVVVAMMAAARGSACALPAENTPAPASLGIMADEALPAIGIPEE